MTKTDFAHHLAEHPRLMGVLFAILLLVTYSGTALGYESMTPGP